MSGGHTQFRVMCRNTQSQKAAKKAIENYFSQLFAAVELERNLKTEMEAVISGVEGEDEREQLRAHLTERIVEDVAEARRPVSLASFHTVAEIGRGSFGTVYLVRQKGSGEYFAMKKIPKRVQQDKSIHRVWAERRALARFDFEGVGKLEFSFQDRKFVYLVMEFMPGGDLMSRLLRESTLTEEETRFYLAEIIVAVNSVHEQGVIHRDLKPDNFVFTADGHLKLLDFGLCKSLPKRRPVANGHGKHVPDPARQREIAAKWISAEHRRRAWQQIARRSKFSAVGTPNYIAPEVLLNRPYAEDCDWWSVGVILYEMLVGFPPFAAGEVANTCRKIIQWEDYFYIPSDVDISDEARDLINQLICEPELRMGKKSGISEFKEHPFFHGFDWSAMYAREAPWRPELSGPADVRNFQYGDGSNPSSSSEGRETISEESDEAEAEPEPAFRSRRSSLSHYLAEGADDTQFAGFMYRRVKSPSLQRLSIEKYASVSDVSSSSLTNGTEPASATGIQMRSLSEGPKSAKDPNLPTGNILTKKVVLCE